MKKKESLIIIIIGVFLFIQLGSAQTWEGTKRLTWTSGYSDSVEAAVDSNDYIHLIWVDETPGNPELYYRKSTDGGTTWTTKRLTWTSGDTSRPSLAIDSNNHLYLVWFDDTPGNDEIHYKRSTNGGASWTTKRLTWNSGYSSLPSIAVDSNNHIYMIWQDDTSGNGEIYYKKSTNGGTSWTQQRLTWNSDFSGGPQIAIDSNNHFNLVWHDNTPGNVELHFKRSTNGGTSWITQRCTWNSGNSYYPDIAVDSNNHIYVVWYDLTPGDSEIYFKKSTNGGTSWSQQRLTWLSDSSYNPSITTDTSNYIHVVWKEKNPGNHEIYYKRSTNGGTSWTTKRLTFSSGGSNNPKVVTDSSNHIYVFWSDSTPGISEIYFRKGIQ